MKALIVCASLLAASVPAFADDLADAQKAWENKDFVRAFQGFTTLAKAGNATAQWQLGEMYGFGEGTAEDSVQAEYWLKQAAALGFAEAPASLGLVRERNARKTDISYYTERFDGADRAYSQYGCVRPVIPQKSVNNAEISAVNQSVNQWAACHGRFIVDLNKAMPPQNTISPAVLKLMSNAEYQRASTLIAQVYEKFGLDAQKLADQVSQENAAWKSETEKYIAENNEKVAGKIESDKVRFDRYTREQQDDVTRRINAHLGVKKQ
jgi:hypothetical protein